MPSKRKSSHDFVCEFPRCGFASTGWPSAAAAAARGAQHESEHKTGEPMPELADFNPKES